MNKIVLTVASMIALSVAGSAFAASMAPSSQGQHMGENAVQIKGNTELSTKVGGDVKQTVEGNKNKVNTNVGGVQGAAQIMGNTKVKTEVKGDVVNKVKGNENTSNVNVGGIAGGR